MFLVESAFSNAANRIYFQGQQADRPVSKPASWHNFNSHIASSVAGGLIVFYQIGYGIVAFGRGPLQT
jgi:hypothetical protein